ncbi:universal stress protein [Noviherbaspirillum pedocola]|uniref:Universal stress protein n=1 Tax=Noviherbaspirillum pedocola TaxID=2801341 RepID=A0A934SW20_9BURK|nr:universal stress protein [Noviherbaspirillum pedocola]MBK4737625.1 universal stress protein [Noviherbaspirillum pedocola]
MTSFPSLLLPLDGSVEAARGVDCALWLADALDATLHVLHVLSAGDSPTDNDEALARLHVPSRHPRVILHQIKDGTAASLLRAIGLHRVRLVVMSAGGASASAGRRSALSLGSIARAVIEGSPVPVLLIPMAYRQALPWSSILAAASGELASAEALAFALRLAGELRIRVSVLHAEDDPGIGRGMPLCAYPDAAYHEYRERLRDMVERSLASCPHERRHCIAEAMLRPGDPAAVLLEQVAAHEASVLALGWHGALDQGRALVLKRLLLQAECALLLVRGKETVGATLKVGEEFNA